MKTLSSKIIQDLMDFGADPLARSWTSSRTSISIAAKMERVDLVVLMTTTTQAKQYYLNYQLSRKQQIQLPPIESLPARSVEHERRPTEIESRPYRSLEHKQYSIGSRPVEHVCLPGNVTINKPRYKVA
jgi:hypothetical protein